MALMTASTRREGSGRARHVAPPEVVGPDRRVCPRTGAAHGGKRPRWTESLQQIEASGTVRYSAGPSGMGSADLKAAQFAHGVSGAPGTTQMSAFSKRAWPALPV